MIKATASSEAVSVSMRNMRWVNSSELLFLDVSGFWVSRDSRFMGLVFNEAFCEAAGILAHPILSMGLALGFRYCEYS